MKKPDKYGCGAGPVCAGQLAGGAGGRLQRRGGQADHRYGACAERLFAAAEAHGTITLKEIGYLCIVSLRDLCYNCGI